MSYKKDIWLKSPGWPGFDIWLTGGEYTTADPYLIVGQDFWNQRQRYDRGDVAAPPPPLGATAFVSWIFDDYN